jgi:hypothetical protein
MKKEELIGKINQLLESDFKNINKAWGNYAMACDILKQYGGRDNSFLRSLEAMPIVKANKTFINDRSQEVLVGFVKYLELELLQNISPERKAQIETVSDYLEQAQILLDTTDVHAAAPAILIGASLEEFLRGWIESEDISLNNKKPGIDSYAKTLREKDYINKQDIKDITAWAGIRNDAAHGNWDAVEDKSRIRIMLDSVNLFMRKYNPEDK